MTKSYARVIRLKHPFFGKVRIDSTENVGELCHSVAKDRGYSEDEEVVLLKIVFREINKFLKKYPKTGAKVLTVQLSVGSCLASYGLSIYGDVGETYTFDSGRYFQDLRQEAEEMEAKIQEYLSKYGFEETADHTPVRVHLRGKSVVVERCMLQKMQNELSEISPNLYLLSSEVSSDERFQQGAVSEESPRGSVRG